MSACYSSSRWAESHDPNKLDATISFKVYITMRICWLSRQEFAERSRSTSLGMVRSIQPHPIEIEQITRAPQDFHFFSHWRAEPNVPILQPARWS
mmetsp:Transcript_14010/g.48321  ORF Transcript_14010/g.48321 Transcript_14010/m.48321 type:complete len:95 (-) Transcript_14010:642-926(-)